MLHFSNTPPPSRLLMKPRRSDSLRASGSGNDKGQDLLASLAEELHDIKRVRDYGQEEDLKEALGKMIGRVEEIVRLLSLFFSVRLSSLAFSNRACCSLRRIKHNPNLRLRSSSRSRTFRWRWQTMRCSKMRFDEKVQQVAEMLDGDVATTHKPISLHQHQMKARDLPQDAVPHLTLSNPHRPAMPCLLLQSHLHPSPSLLPLLNLLLQTATASSASASVHPQRRLVRTLVQALDLPPDHRRLQLQHQLGQQPLNDDRSMPSGRGTQHTSQAHHCQASWQTQASANTSSRRRWRPSVRNSRR